MERIIAIIFLLILLCILCFCLKSSELFLQEPATLLYIMYHDEKSKVIANTIINDGMHLLELPKSPYFEGIVFDLLAERRDWWKQKRFVGQIAYSFCKKFGIDGTLDLRAVSRTAIEHDSEVVFLIPGNHDMLGSAINNHGTNFQKAWYLLLQLLGYNELDSDSRNIPFHYCNAWIARPEFMEHYISIVSKAKSLMDTNSTLSEICMRDASYNQSFNMVDTKVLMEMNGTNHYTLHPFIIERLICFVCWQEKRRIACINPTNGVLNYIGAP
jgi:hypothetical protein